MTPEFRELVRQGRRDQGLPDHVEDETVLYQVAALLLEPSGEVADGQVA